MTSVFPVLRSRRLPPHALHSSERIWPETNCYVDLWIEVLNALGLPPEAMLGFTLTQDFEGDQFTFFKVPLEDLGSALRHPRGELAIFDRVERSVGQQIARGRLCLIEMDSFYHARYAGRRPIAASMARRRSPSTGSCRQRTRRSSISTMAAIYQLDGRGFRRPVRAPLSRRGRSPSCPIPNSRSFRTGSPAKRISATWRDRLLRRHFSRRPAENPIRAFAKQFPQQVRRIAERPFGFFHKYAFNTLRQFGANFELAARSSCMAVAGQVHESRAKMPGAFPKSAKTVQFQLARAVTRRKFDPLQTALDPAADAWDSMMASICRAALTPGA